MTLSLDGEEFSVLLSKVDRSGLYGEVTIEAFDEHGHPAEIKVLAADGSTLIDVGGTALEMVNKAGTSVDKDEVHVVDLKGDEIDEVESSFQHVNKLKEAEVEDYLSTIVKSIYWLQPAEGSKLNVLLDNLKDGRIFNFPFSYRDGILIDEAFLIGSKSEAFMIVGNKARLEFLKYDEPVFLDSPDDDEISADDLTFEL